MVVLIVLISDSGPLGSSSEFRTEICNRLGLWTQNELSWEQQSERWSGISSENTKEPHTLALSANTDTYIAILDYRNAPTQGMESSSAHCLIDMKTRTLLPTTRTVIHPRALQSERDIQQLNRRQFQQFKYHNQHACDLHTLKVGDVVRMKPFQLGSKECKKGTMTSKLDERSKIVKARDIETT